MQRGISPKLYCRKVHNFILQDLLFGGVSSVYYSEPKKIFINDFVVNKGAERNSMQLQRNTKFRIKEQNVYI